MSNRINGHILDEDGVTETPFVRADGAITNAEEITIRPGGALTVELGGYPVRQTMVLVNPAGPVEFTFEPAEAP